MTGLLTERLAAVLIDHSLGVRAGDGVLIRGTTTAAPLVRELYRGVLQAGGYPELQLDLDGREEALLELGEPAQLDWVNPSALEAVERVDCRVQLFAPRNTRSLSGVDPARQARRSRAAKPIIDAVDRRAAAGELRSVLTVYPTEALAQEAGMSLADYQRFVAASGFLDRDDPAAEWGALAQRIARLSSWLETVRVLRVLAPGTDLTLGVEGRRWVPACGRENFPDGEIYTAPLEDAVDGEISFELLLLHGGRPLQGVRLAFRDGEVVEATARRGSRALDELLLLDAGARRAGEFAFGLNDAISRFTGEPLFDEKVGGTVHLALGSAYAECGGTNDSALHCDLVLDLRQGGLVYADGELVYRDGAFLGGRF
ncbi:MAG: aminopeptidase [Actinomycetia bacterium]|nr:aminopeptidase [Actinomycetes bacterium]